MISVNPGTTLQVRDFIIPTMQTRKMRPAVGGHLPNSYRERVQVPEPETLPCHLQPWLSQSRDTGLRKKLDLRAQCQVSGLMAEMANGLICGREGVDDPWEAVRLAGSTGTLKPCTKSTEMKGKRHGMQRCWGHNLTNFSVCVSL